MSRRGVVGWIWCFEIGYRDPRLLRSQGACGAPNGDADEKACNIVALGDMCGAMWALTRDVCALDG